MPAPQRLLLSNATTFQTSCRSTVANSWMWANGCSKASYSSKAWKRHGLQFQINQRKYSTQITPALPLSFKKSCTYAPSSYLNLSFSKFAASSILSRCPNISLPSNTAATPLYMISGLSRTYSTQTKINEDKQEKASLPNAENIVETKDAIKDAVTTQIPKSQVTKDNTPHENIYTIPNILTFTRLVSAPIIGYLVVNQQLNWAASLFAYSCVTDFVDGWIARRWKLQTVVGSVIDPMADKILMMTLASCLAVSGNIPLYMAVVILGRDFLLGLSALYYRYISLPPPKTFTRYWDFSIPSAEVHPTTISKYNTFFQMIYLGSALLFPVATSSLEAIGDYGVYVDYLTLGLKGLEYTVATTTVLSGLSYVFSKNAVKILKP